MKRIYRYNMITLTFLRSINIYAIRLGWFIVYIEGSQVIVSKKYLISFSEDQFCLRKQFRP